MLCRLFRIHCALSIQLFLMFPSVLCPAQCGVVHAADSETMQDPTALFWPEQSAPPSDAGGGGPRTPAWSPRQVAHAPQNGCECAAVGRRLFDPPQLQHLAEGGEPCQRGRARASCFTHSTNVAGVTDRATNLSCAVIFSISVVRWGRLSFRCCHRTPSFSTEMQPFVLSLSTTTSLGPFPLPQLLLCPFLFSS